ncbi:MAG: hypothetical protein P8183_22730, partial [Anaerolineae bacterium]
MNQPGIVLFSSSDWFGKWGSRQQVAQLWAKHGHRVLFVEQMAGLEHFIKYRELRHQRWRHWRQGLRQQADNLWLSAPPPLLPGRYYVPHVAEWNAFWLSRWLKEYLDRLGLASPLLWFYK